MEEAERRQQEAEAEIRREAHKAYMKGLRARQKEELEAKQARKRQLAAKRMQKYRLKRKHESHPE